jgi:monoamine oxidase
MMMQKHCVVIGAGLSGLAAAYYLKKNCRKPDDVRVTLIEARDRVGGRVFSFKFREEDEYVCELGGEWIGDQHERMRGLCKHFGLKLIRHRFDYSFVRRNTITETISPDKWLFAPNVENKFAGLSKAFQSKIAANDVAWLEEFDRRDWWTILRDLGFGEEDLLRRDLMDSTDFGESIRQVGGYSAGTEYFNDDRFDAMDWKIEGGNSRLAFALAKTIGEENIHTSEKAIEVIQNTGTERRKDSSNVQVFVESTLGAQFPAGGKPNNPRKYDCDACICTVPARTLRKIKFNPDLPATQREAAEELQYARIMKTVLLFDNRFWMRDKATRFSCMTDSVSDFMFDATLGQDQGPLRVNEQPGILCSYSVGDKADDQASRGPESLRQALESILGQLFPGTTPAVVAIHRYAWQRDDFTEGAYALYRPGQWFDVSARLKQEHHDVHFAGEHIADDQGFMEGAVDTGEQAAEAVLKKWGLKAR